MLDAKTPTNKHNQALYMFMILKKQKELYLQNSWILKE